MANKDRIDELISESAFQQVEKLDKELVGLNETFVKCLLSVEKYNAAVAKSGGLKELIANQKKYEDQVLKTALAEEKVVQAKLKTQALEQKIISDREKNEARNAAIAQKETDRENARIVREAKKGKAIISNSQLEIDAYNNTVNGSKKVTSTINDQNKAYASATSSAAAYATSTKKVAVETLKVSPAAISAQKSINSLKIQLQSYKNIADNATNPKIISEFNAKAEQTEATIGRLSNVGKKGFDEFGNSINRTTGFAGKAWGALKTVANVLPGLGIAGVLAFATEPIIEYVRQLDIFKKSANDIVNISALGASEYKEAISDVAKLKSAISEFDSGVISSTEVVKVYNEGIGKTAGALSTVTEVEAFYNSKAEAYVQAMLLRAKANAALQLSTDKITEAQIRAADSTNFTDKLLATGKNILKSLSSGGFGNFANILGDAQDNQAEAVAKLNEEGEDYLRLFERLKTESDKFNAANGLNLNGSTDKSKVNTDEYDLQKQRLEILRASYSQIADDEKQSMNERIDALRDYNETSRELIELEANNALSKAGISEKRRLIIREKANADLLNADKDYSDKANKIFQDQLNEEQKERLRINQQELAAINEAESVKLDALNSSFANWTISEKQYGELRQNIQREYIQKYIEAEIQQVQDLLEIASLSADQRADYEKKLSDLKLKLSREVTKNQIEDNKAVTKEEEDNAKKRADIEKQLSANKKELLKEVFDLGVSIVNGSFENEKNKVQKEIDVNEQKTQSEIENVNNSVATEEEKANKIAIIKAKAEAQNVVLEQRKREIAKEQAKFEKAANIASITMSTYSAAAAALRPPPVGLGPVAGIPLAALTVGVGLAQIGKVIATPIPQYFTGTDSSKAGYALTDELGPELYIPKSGKPYLGSDKPNIKNLQAGTKIIPHHELVRLTAKPDLYPELSKFTVDVSGIIAEQRSSTKKIIKAYSNQKSYSTIITKRGWRNTQSGMDNLNRYVKNNFN